MRFSSESPLDLYWELVINGHEKPGLLVPCRVVLRAGIRVVQVAHEEQGLQTWGFWRRHDLLLCAQAVRSRPPDLGSPFIPTPKPSVVSSSPSGQRSARPHRSLTWGSPHCPALLASPSYKARTRRWRRSSHASRAATSPWCQEFAQRSDR